jgi:anaerobic selenocysteine-containing dehydrogenase
MENEESGSRTGIGRRTFLKGMGALGLVAAGAGSVTEVLGQATTPTAPAGKEVPANSICDMCCTGYCGIQVMVKDGVATRTQPWADYPNGPNCVRGNSGLHQLYSPERLKYPMKRTNPKGSKEAGWQRISWDEALTTIATKLNEIKAKYGAEKVLFYSGDPKESTRPPLQRLALKFGSPNYGTESSVCSRATTVATSCCGAGGVGLSANTNAIIVWAHNPGWSMPREMQSYVDAKNRGMKIIDVDPKQVPFTKLADIHLQIRPGTDGALAHALANVIIAQGLYDKDFVNNWTEGFDQYKEYVAQFTPEKAAGICGVPAERITAAAIMFASNTPTAWQTSASPTVHHWNGGQNHRAIDCMVALTGAVAVPGLKPSVPAVSFRSLAEWETLLPPLASKRVDLKYFPVWAQFIEEIQVNKLPEYVTNGDLKAGLFLGGNFRMWPGDQQYNKAFSDMEFAAGADFWMTPSMQLMDIVLPVATSYERLGPPIVAGRTIFVRQPVVQPIGEARGDTELLLQLGTKMGMGADFWNGDLKASLNWQLEPLKLTVDDLLKAPKGITIPPGQPTPASPKPGFKTPSTKFEFVSGVLTKAGFDGLPVYKEPPEGPANAEMVKSFPLIFNTGSREPFFQHTRHRNNPRLRELQPDPKLDINPVDAASRGIKQEDNIVVSTPLGKLTVKANLTQMAKPGQVHLYHGWVEADVNSILPRTFDPITGFPAFKSQLCQVAKA